LSKELANRKDSETLHIQTSTHKKIHNPDIPSQERKHQKKGGRGGRKERRGGKKKQQQQEG
jgi:hypothetical protein